MKVQVEMQDFTPQLLFDLQKKQLSFVTQGGESIRSEMVSRAARRTGNLANSIQTQAFVQDGGASSETGPTADYAVYVEYGTGIHAKNGDGRKDAWSYKDENGKWWTTHGMEAQPFAEPGFQAAKPIINRLAETVLRV